jgi:hypothetical protein
MTGSGKASTKSGCWWRCWARTWGPLIVCDLHRAILRGAAGHSYHCGREGEKVGLGSVGVAARARVLKKIHKRASWGRERCISLRLTAGWGGNDKRHEQRDRHVGHGGAVPHVSATCC